MLAGGGGQGSAKHIVETVQPDATVDHTDKRPSDALYGKREEESSGLG